MAVDAPPATGEVAAAAATATDHAPHHRQSGESRLRRVWRFLAMPLLLIAILVGLRLYVGGQTLDSIEARQLTAAVITEKLVEHITASGWSTLFVILIAVPMGILATRPSLRRWAPVIVGFGNFGQAIPSLGLLTIIFLAARELPFLPSTGIVPVVAALVAYSALPILRNTMVGLQQVDPNLLQAARGMGLSNTQVLRKIEMPLAVPVILAGVRTALIINVGTAALVFLFGGGGLGELIFQGFQLRRTPILMTGAVLTAVLALFVDYLGGLVEELLTPEGL